MFKKFAIVVAAFALLALPACGTSTAAGSAVKLVPAKSSFYIQIKNPYSWDAAKKTRTFAVLKGFGGAKGATNFDQLLDDAMKSKSTTADEISISRDVKPWLGANITLAAIPQNSSSPTTTTTNSLGSTSSSMSFLDNSAGIVMLDSKDDAKAKTFITKWKKQSPDVAAEIFDGMVVGINGKNLCDSCSNTEAVAKAETELKTITALKAADSLDNDATFKDVKSRSGSDKDLFLYVHTPKKSSTGATAASAALATCVGGTTGANSDGTILGMSADMSGSDAAVTVALKQTTPTTSGKATLLGTLPDDTVFALDTHGFGALLTKEFSCLGQNDPSVGSSLSAFSQGTGLDLTQEFAWMKGETAITLGDITGKEIGLVTDASDGASAKKSVDDLTSAITKAGLSPTQKEAGVYTVAYGATLPDLSYGVKNGRFIIAASNAYFDKLSKTDAKPLSASAAYTKAVVPSEDNAGVLYLQPDKLASTAGSLISNVQTRDAFRQIDGIGFRAKVDGSYSVLTGAITFVTTG